VATCLRAQNCCELSFPIRQLAKVYNVQEINIGVAGSSLNESGGGAWMNTAGEVEHLIQSEFRKGRNGSRRGRAMARIAVMIALCLAATGCFADAALTNIVSNDNQTPAGRLAAGVLTLRLELRNGMWHPEAQDGQGIEAYSFAEEGHEPQIPGPLIRVAQGTELRVSVHNLLPVAVFVHGLDQHPGNGSNAMQLAPGETKEARFSAGEAGSYGYWASTEPGPFEARRGRDGSMSGAFIVDAPGADRADRVFVIQLWDRGLFTSKFEGELTINGKSWPYTERLHASLGHPEHWRIVNASGLEHPMHLHGFYFRVDAVGDGETERHLSEAEQRRAVTEVALPGHTFDMTWVPERAGNWLFHCHIMDHMSKYKSPVLYGPEGSPDDLEHEHHAHDFAMGMSNLVLGITVSGDQPTLTSAKAVLPAAASERHLFVRQRSAGRYVPAGPGFYLEGTSHEVGAIGPPLVITRGERTAITVSNELNEPTAIHWHGLEIESYYDGVPGWDGTTQRTTPFIAPGSSFVAYMTPPRAGTFIYHTHWHDIKQLTGGMYGALLVLEPGQKYDPASDKTFVLGRGGPNEMRDPLLVNGSPQPGLMVLLAGQTYRFRFVNITPNDALVATSLLSENHPAKWRALAKDGADLPAKQATEREAAQTISVGETYDFEFTPKEPGDFELRFCSEIGNEVTQMIAVVPAKSPFSVFAANH
jgi:FtsP/CotA-like multicopper oxidase with cupredoxin domain